MAEDDAQAALYLVCQPGPGVADRLDAALEAAPVAALLIAPAAGTELTPADSKPLVELAQKNGVAALIADDVALARIVKADGVHLSWSKDQEKRFAKAREDLGVRYMLGVDAGRSRHDAMMVGEGGAEYVAFGIPAHVEDRATAKERQRELISWWSELFEVPCVAFNVENAEDAARLAVAGADFVAVQLPEAMTAKDTAVWTKRIADALNVRESVT